MFFELEPVECRPFTKAGVPSKRLAAAIKQIDDWSEYFSSHKGLIREDLVWWAKNRDLLGYSKGEEPCNFSGERLADPETYLEVSYYIIAGRRSASNSAERRRKGQYYLRHGIEIASYDRMIDLARDRYADTSLWNT